MVLFIDKIGLYICRLEESWRERDREVEEKGSGRETRKEVR